MTSPNKQHVDERGCQQKPDPNTESTAENRLGSRSQLALTFMPYVCLQEHRFYPEPISCVTISCIQISVIHNHRNIDPISSKKKTQAEVRGCTKKQLHVEKKSFWGGDRSWYHDDRLEQHSRTAVCTSVSQTAFNCIIKLSYKLNNSLSEAFHKQSKEDSMNRLVEVRIKFQDCADELQASKTRCKILELGNKDLLMENATLTQHLQYLKNTTKIHS